MLYRIAWRRTQGDEPLPGQHRQLAQHVCVDAQCAELAQAELKGRPCARLLAQKILQRL